MLKKVLGLILVGVLCLSPMAFADNTAVSQTQSQSNSGALIDNSNQDNRVKSINRNLPVPGNTPIPGTNGFFTAPTPDSSFRNMVEVLRFAGPIFSEGALDEMKSGADIESHFQLFNSKKRVKRAAAPFIDEKEGNVPHIKVIIDHNGNLKAEGEVRFFAAVDGEADDAETNSIQVMADMAQDCLKNGGNLMVITNQGAHRRVEASGWGIGFYTVGSQISDGGQTAGLVGGGTGYASNQAGPEDLPWLHGYCGVRMEPVVPDLPRAGLPN
jgi:hypothetical protein